MMYDCGWSEVAITLPQTGSGPDFTHTFISSGTAGESRP